MAGRRQCPTVGQGDEITTTQPRRAWRGTFDLLEILDASPGGRDLAVRDFALVTLACELTSAFPGQLVFKGGFVLRHAYGHVRFSSDVDATRHDPAKVTLDAELVATTIRNASIHNIITFTPRVPVTDSTHSLDFDDVSVSGQSFADSSVQVEVSYREAVVGDPVPIGIGPPFYEPFEVLTMDPSEMAAEKLRALAQRVRATDLADLAVLLGNPAVRDDDIARFAEVKFKLVKRGRANRIERIERHMAFLADEYDDVIPGLFPGAPDYASALEIVMPRIMDLVPPSA